MREPGQRVTLYKDPYVRLIKDGEGILIRKVRENGHAELWTVLLTDGRTVNRKLIRAEYE